MVSAIVLSSSILLACTHNGTPVYSHSNTRAAYNTPCTFPDQSEIQQRPFPTHSLFQSHLSDPSPSTHPKKTQAHQYCPPYRERPLQRIPARLRRSQHSEPALSSLALLPLVDVAASISFDDVSRFNAMLQSWDLGLASPALTCLSSSKHSTDLLPFVLSQRIRQILDGPQAPTS